MRTGLLALSAFLLAAASTPVPNDGAQSKKAEATERVKRASKSSVVPEIESARAANASEYERLCKEGEYNNRSDLCAQWYAARTAGDAADWAYWSLIVGAIGAIGIVVALLLTIDSNRIARDTAKRQLRAYISIEPGGINEAQDGMCRTPIQICNVGQTPAHHLEVFGDFLIVGGDPRQFDPKDHSRFSGELASTDMSLGGNSERWNYAYLPAEVPEPFWHDIAGKKKAIVHYGFLRYRDVFDDTHETHFAFYHWGEELSDAEAKRCRFGNWST